MVDYIHEIKAEDLQETLATLNIILRNINTRLLRLEGIKGGLWSVGSGNPAQNKTISFKVDGVTYYLLAADSAT